MARAFPLSSVSCPRLFRVHGDRWPMVAQPKAKPADPAVYTEESNERSPVLRGFRMSVSRPVRIVIAGGGTGGHVLPAVSVIERIQARNVPAEYLWIGSGQVERDAAERSGIRFACVQSGKFRRYADIRTVTDA